MTHKDHGIGFFYGKDRRKTRRFYHTLKDKPYNKINKADDEYIQTETPQSSGLAEDME